jgi:energy-converting hydrogenase B subunit K
VTVAVEMVKTKPVTVRRSVVVIDPAKCVHCGRCAYYCPAGAIDVRPQPTGTCTHCGVCAEVCPVGAIDLKTVNDREKVVKPSCVLCMKCVRTCPQQAIKVENGVVRITPMSVKPEIVQCVNCDLCQTACPTGALKRGPGRVRFNASLCTLVEKCISVCPPGTRKRLGAWTGGTCVLCGRCVKVCPYNAVSIKALTWDGSVSEEKCIKCGTCVEICPVKIITLDALRMNAPKVDVAKCTLCEQCGAYCPRDAIPVRVALAPRKTVGGSIAINKDVCIGCGLCVEAHEKAFPKDPAIELVDGIARVISGKCKYCGACAEICPVNAIRLIKVHDNGRRVEIR